MIPGPQWEYNDSNDPLLQPTPKNTHTGRITILPCLGVFIELLHYNKIANLLVHVLHKTWIRFCLPVYSYLNGVLTVKCLINCRINEHIKILKNYWFLSSHEMVKFLKFWDPRVQFQILFFSFYPLSLDNPYVSDSQIYIYSLSLPIKLS